MNHLLKKLPSNRQKGSKPRCHWLTHGTREQVAKRLTKLVRPWGTVSADNCWMPEGFCDIEEAQLHKATKLLPQEYCEELRDWWLAEPSECSKTPEFDIACTCTINGTEGILLVEAKAHSAELKVEDEAKGSDKNRKRISGRIEEANATLSDLTEPGWALTHKCRYQLANRFAWSAKLTELGYHVILIYLGFIEAEEMRSEQTRWGPPRIPFSCHSEWESGVFSYSEPSIPSSIWNNQWPIHDRILVPRILSCRIQYDAPVWDEQMDLKYSG